MKEKTTTDHPSQSPGRRPGAPTHQNDTDKPPEGAPPGDGERTPRELAAAIRNALVPARGLADNDTAGRDAEDRQAILDAREGLNDAVELLGHLLRAAETARAKLAAFEAAARLETEAATALYEGRRAPEPLYRAAWAALWDGAPPRDGADELEPLYRLKTLGRFPKRCDCCGDELADGDRYADALVSSRPALDGRGAVHVRARLCLTCALAHLTGWLLELVAQQMPYRTRVAAEAEPARGGPACPFCAPGTGCKQGGQ